MLKPNILIRKNDLAINAPCVLYFWCKAGGYYYDEAYGSLAYCLSVAARQKAKDDVVSIDTLSGVAR